MSKYTVLHAPGLEKQAQDVASKLEGAVPVLCTTNIMPDSSGALCWDSFPSGDPNIKLRIEAALASEVHRLQAAAAFRHKAVAAPPSPLPGGWAAADTLEADSARKPARHRASSPILPPRKAPPT